MKLNNEGKFRVYKKGDIVTYLGGMSSYNKYIGCKFKITGKNYFNTAAGDSGRRGLVNNIEFISNNTSNKDTFSFSVYGECIIGSLPALPDE